MVNLSANKRAVLSGAYDSLANGGELHFSDVYCDRRLSAEARSHPVLVGECLGGGLYFEDFKRLCASVGFADVRVLSRAPIAITDPELASLIGEAKFYSLTVRLFKLPPGRLEPSAEDYGEVATYKGTFQGAPHAYVLDEHHTLESNKPKLVSGNTASLLRETWLGKGFSVSGGDRSTHFGRFMEGSAPGGACL